MIAITDVRVDHHIHDIRPEIRCEVMATSEAEYRLLTKAYALQLDLAHAIKIAIEQHEMKHGSWQMGQKLKCISDGNQSAVKEGQIYTFNGYTDAGKVWIKGFNYPFSKTRFEPVKTETVNIIQFGGSSGKTSMQGLHEFLGVSSPIEVNESKGFIDTLKQRLEATPKAKPLPVRRQRKGRKLVP